MSKVKLLARAYRIRKDQDSAIKRKARKEKRGEGEIVREGIDLAVAEYLVLPKIK